MARVRGRDAQRPAGELLLARVLDVVVLRERLVRARERVRLASVLAPEAADVERPDVPLRAAVDDPLAHDLADAARAREPVRAAARGDPEAGHIGLAEQEVRVGRERLRPVEEHLHLGVLHRGHARDRIREELFHAIPLLGQELRLEALGNAVERPRRRLALVAAHDEATDLGAEVDEVVGVAQRRQRLERRVERLGDQVLVAVGDDRQVDADHARELGRVHAGSVDDDLALDAALIGLDGGDAAVLRHLDAGDSNARLDLRADAPRGVRERERELARVEVAVVGDERSREHAAGAHRREALLRLPRR